MPFPTSEFVRQGQFRNVRALGQGTFGQVYYAEDNMGRPVAVKEVLPGNPYAQDARRKFRKEINLLAGLQHPNIITVYTLLTDPQTQEQYLISEYANGGSLRDYLRRTGTLTEEQAIKVAIDICAALEAAWNQQIVHRDVKPGNILLKVDKSGTITSAKLGDFGVAQDLQDSSATNQQGVSHPGTPLYMAPEQASSTNYIDVRADIYALGVTLWLMLTGKEYKPLLNQVDSPVLQHYNSQASQGIDKIIRTAVEIDPSRRYPSPERMAQDLREVLAGRTPVALTVPAGLRHTQEKTELARPRHQSRSSRAVGWFVGLAALVLIGLSIAVAFRVLGQPSPIAVSASPTSVAPASLTSVSTPDSVTELPDTATPTAPQTPTPSETPTPTSTPTPTNTPTLQPTDTPRPTNTPVPPPVGAGTYIENDEIAVTVDSVRFFGPNDDRKGAVYYNIKIRNKTKDKMLVKFSLADITAEDNKNGRYVDYLVKRKSSLDRSCVIELFGGIDYNKAINPEFEVAPEDENSLKDPNGYLYLVKDQGCAPSNAIVEIDVDYIDLTLATISYRTSKSGSMSNLTWRLQR